MYITLPEVTNYLEGLYRPLSSHLAELRREAEEKNIPIILKDAEELILNYIYLKRPRHILEIGTAVGYSAICFASADCGVQITTLEIKEDMVQEAEKNILKFKMHERISVMRGDARESLENLVKQYENQTISGFDMVFIDAAKGHYREFWDQAVKMLRPGAVILSDNVLYKAMTASDSCGNRRKHGTIMRRMREYLSYITNLEGVHSAVLPVGDGIAISLFQT